ncbi:SCO6745 family protein [Streptomyces solicathayae]|uniref:SalK n=1 Tax=Streptomyces solicathayae TaxID=3081768 RepID=A0ABZ0M079_9ACTN|nr:hypothetical protein [Streptomyces sp. HUAS YS2]WOX24965.1 hypothetical protein R2D22_27705 [Streptomyces sp. HUAS YS2]
MDTTSRTPVQEPLARTLWTLFEPLHAVTYFAPECAAAFEEAGLRGFWRGYFAGRAAPFGATGPAPVTSAFFNFAPSMAARALPAVWEKVPPAEALRLRAAGARAALRRLLAGLEKETERAAELLAARLDGLDCAGRPLAAVNAALPRPEDAAGLLWHAATVLREHRGDGHVAALVAAGLDGCEILVLRAGHDTTRTELQPYRGWTDDQWEAAMTRLVRRGLLTPDGRATAEADRLLATIEAATDTAAARPWADPEDADGLAARLRPLAVAAGNALRWPNPIGVRRTTD